MILGALVFPLLLVSLHAEWLSFVWDPFLFKVAVGASQQALLSTLLSLLLGGLGALGLLGVAPQIRPARLQILQFLLILPGFIPPLLVVTLSTKVLHHLPIGLGAVVFFHVLMNVGLISVLMFQLLISRGQSWIDFAQVANISPWCFMTRGLAKELRFELKAIAFYFFILYFFSFSIPFLVGGSSFGGLEVFLYEKIVMFGEWGQAAGYALLLFGFVFLLSLLIKEKKSWDPNFQPVSLSSFTYLGYGPLILVAAFPLVFLLAGLVLSWPNMMAESFTESIQGIRGSLIIGLGVGMLSFLLLTILAFCFISGWMGRVLRAFVHPGWVIVGFAFLLLPGQSVGSSFVKIIFALALLYIPFLYRLSFHESLQNLRTQVQVSANLPVTWSKVYFQILFPQLLPKICLLSGLSGLWACGDFAITGFFVETSEVQTLAFQMKQVLSHYRSEQAVNFLWPLLFCGAVVFFSFQGLIYVSGQKFKS